MVTQQSLEVESMKHSTQLLSDPTLPRGGFGILLLSGDCATSSQAMSHLNGRLLSFLCLCTHGADSGDFWGCRIEAAAYTMQLTFQDVLGFTARIHWLIAAC